MDLRDTLRRVLLANELGNNERVAYRFSDPDGVRTGKSGWSFGRCQFDLQNNPRAAACLREIGFTEPEILGLKQQAYGPAAMARFNARLLAAAAEIDRLDQEEFDGIARHVLQVTANAGLHLADEETFTHLCDYHNQYSIEFGGKCVRYLQRLGRPITPEDVRAYKLTTLWGTKRPDDVERRYNNIVRIVRGGSPR